MKHKLKILSFAIVVSLVLSVLINIAMARPNTNSRAQARLNRDGGIQAQQGFAEQGRREEFRGERPRPQRGNPVEMIIHMAQRLELTEEQVAALEAIPVPDPEELKAQWEAMSDLKKQLNAAIHAGDVVTVTEIAGEISDYTLTSSIEKAQLFAQINEVLTEEQKAQLAEFSQRMQMRQRHAGPRSGEGFGPEAGQRRRGPRPEGEQTPEE